MKPTFASVLRSLGVVIIGYLLFSLVNMGLVLLFFNGDFKPAAFLVILTLLIIVPLSTYFFIRFIFWLVKRNGAIHTCIILALVGLVTLFNIYLGISLEPLYYKLVYLTLVITSGLLAVKKRQSRA